MASKIKRTQKRCLRIVALNPPYFPKFSRASRSPAVTKSSTLYYPFLLAYATGALEDDGFEVKLIDAPAAGLSRTETIRAIKEAAPHLVICETSTPSIENDLEVIGELKCAGVPFVAAVGTHVSALSHDVMQANPFLDAVARGEYECTVRDLARALDAAEPSLDGVQGLTYRSGWEIKKNPDRDYIEDLDRLPFVSRVYRDHLRQHLGAYFYGANLHPVVTILSGRGCPHRCAYCVYPQTMTGNAYRFRSVGNLVDELEFIKKELPEAKEVFIEDDTLTADRERARSIAKEIISRGLKIRWSANSRADADYETMRLMRRAGLRLLCVGFESGSQEILNRLGKNIRYEKYMKFRGDAKKAGVLIHGCFMYGNEGETRETMQGTLELAKKLGCDSAQFYPIMVYPGTRSYESFREKGYIKAASFKDWLTPEGLHNCIISLPGISGKELVEFSDRSRREFYLRTGYIFSKVVQMITRPSEAKRLIRAGKALSRFIIGPERTRP